MTALRKILVSVIIRTLNEEKYLSELLNELKNQQSNSFIIETIIVGKLMKVNPFDQPAVEQVKVLTKNFLN